MSRKFFLRKGSLTRQKHGLLIDPMYTTSCVVHLHISGQSYYLIGMTDEKCLFKTDF